MENNEINDDPVYYCTHCLSMNIRILDSYTDYCDNCGSTDIEVTDLDTWEKLCIQRFGKPLYKD